MKNINSFFGSPFSDVGSISKLTTLALNIIITVAGIILLFYFIIGGIGMIGSAGKSDPRAMEAAKQSITTGLVGFVIVITSYLIVKLILTLLNINGLI